MGVKGMLLKSVNSALKPTGFKLQRPVQDFDARLDKPEQLRRMFTEIGGVAEIWLSRQTLFSVLQHFSAADELQSFFDAYLASPFREIGGGSRFNNLAWLFLIAKAMQPTVVIDSGTFKGASAWAFALAVPDAKVFSFDIDLSNLRLRVDGVTYIESDWLKFDWKTRDISRGLIYFDDHLDQARRLIEAVEIGLPIAIFDDDFSITSFAPMANNGIALPKIEFVLDDELRNWQEISWIDGSGRHSFPVQREYLEHFSYCCRALNGSRNQAFASSAVSKGSFCAMA